MNTYIAGNTYPVKDQLRALGCRWDPQRKQWYADTPEMATQAQAIVQPHPLYSSPPPQDLGTADPAALAARYGRTAIQGATVQSFDVYGLAKGDNGQPDGAVRVVRNKRYVQVARTPRRYLSADWLEDMDEFDAQPGGSYQWDGVEIEPTPAEAEADAAKRQAAALKASWQPRTQAVIAQCRKGERPWAAVEPPTLEELRQRYSAPDDTLAEWLASGQFSRTAMVPEGDRYLDTQTIYGGGDWFVIGPEYIWYCKNNGSDGADWSDNNVRTGGAGAIGWRIPYEETIAAEIRALAAEQGRS